MSAHTPEEQRTLRFARLIEVELRAHAQSSLGAFAALHREPVEPLTVASAFADCEMRHAARRALDAEIDRAGLVNDCHRCFQTGRFATGIELAKQLAPLRVAA
jgi:hypothetical protein